MKPHSPSESTRDCRIRLKCLLSAGPLSAPDAPRQKIFQNIVPSPSFLQYLQKREKIAICPRHYSPRVEFFFLIFLHCPPGGAVVTLLPHQVHSTYIPHTVFYDSMWNVLWRFTVGVCQMEACWRAAQSAPKWGLRLWAWSIWRAPSSSSTGVSPRLSNLVEEEDDDGGGGHPKRAPSPPPPPPPSLRGDTASISAGRPLDAAGRPPARHRPRGSSLWGTDSRGEKT